MYCTPKYQSFSNDNSDVNEVKTYSISVLPDKWDIKNNTTIDVTVTSKYHSVKNDFSKNSAIYENNTFDKTITIGTKETDGDAEYSAKLPSVLLIHQHLKILQNLLHKKVCLDKVVVSNTIL